MRLGIMMPWALVLELRKEISSIAVGGSRCLFFAEDHRCVVHKCSRIALYGHSIQREAPAGRV